MIATAIAAALVIRNEPNAVAGTEKCWECGKAHPMRTVRAVVRDQKGDEHGAICLRCLQDDSGETGARIWNAARNLAHSVGCLDLIGWGKYDEGTAEEARSAARRIAIYIDALLDGTSAVEGTVEALASAREVRS